MPPKKAHNVRKRRDSIDSDDETILSPGAVSDVGSEMNPADSDVIYKIQSVQSTHLRDLLDFLSDPKMINAANNPSTNIIDRQSGKCYNIPEKKIPKYFKLLEACRRNKIQMMMTERQQTYSGIMLDFDIYQDVETDQLTDEMFYILCHKIIEILMKIINFGEVKKESIHIGITRRPKIVYNDKKDCHKDGFHMIIPGIKITKGAKRLLLNKMLDNEILDQILADVVPAKIQEKSEDYQRKHFLDTHSAVVPVFFVGSNTKKGHAAYKLTHIYEATVNFDTKSIMLVRNDTMMNDKSANIVNEFSLNYTAPDGYIVKKNYEVQEKFLAETIEMEKPTKDAEDANRNFGLLSMNSIHDAQVKELESLLDTLHVKRADDYSMWLNVLFALANTSTSYKYLGEYFTRKSTKPSRLAKFESTWESAVRGAGTNRKSVTLASIHYWAKQDNPERYDQLRKQSVYNVLYSMVYEGYLEGKLQHAHIADILYRLLRYKYITDIPEGEKTRAWYEFMLDDDDHVEGQLYKWHRWHGLPVSLSRYISETLPKLFEMVFKNVKKNYENSTGDISKYYNKVLCNFKITMQRLSEYNFKKNIIEEAAIKFNKMGFTDTLDKDPLVRGVANGVLKLSTAPGGKPTLIQGHHTYPVSKFTKVPYIPFDPYDPMTKELVITLRKIFPDNEPDTFEFMMSYLSSTIDGNPKESMFLMLVGKGANGKSFLVEMHKAAIGELYCAKMPLSYLTGKSTNADNATPAQMMLKDASLAYYSESDRYEKLNAARIKEVTGLETIAGRKLHQDMVNFKPKCHHLVTTNYDFDVECGDHGTWRRMNYMTLKITFVDPACTAFDLNDPHVRIGNDKVTTEWTENPEVRGRYLGFMTWMHYWLYRKYGGKVKRVPHKHVQFETNKYRIRQDKISAFLAQRLVKCVDPESQLPMSEEVQKYVRWYTLNHGGVLPAKGIAEMFQNSPIGKMIKNTSRGLFLVGHRFLDNGGVLETGEEFSMRDVFSVELPEDNFGIEPETPEQYYERLCGEYDKHKHIFNGSAEFDVDCSSNAIVDMDEDDVASNMPSGFDSTKRDDNLVYDGVILPSGIKLRRLEEPTMRVANDLDDMTGYLPIDSDCDEDD